MNNLIDYTYFTDNVIIPNADDSGYAGQALEDQVSRYIARYQLAYLRELLGQTLYDEFKTGMETLPIATKWTNLKNKLVDATNKISPIAEYVWYYWYRDNILAKTGMGDGMPTGNNISIRVNAERVVDVWNEMIRLSEQFDVWISANLATYPDYVKGNELYMPLNSVGI